MIPAPRARIAVLALVAPAGYLLLAAQGLQAHHLCLFGEPLGFRAALLQEARAFGQVPVLLAFLPFAGLALMQGRRPGPVLPALWLLALLLLLVPLATRGFSDCDRKGSDSVTWLMVASLPALVLAVLALALSARKNRTA